MSRHVLTVDLRDDPAAIAAYREYHQRVWPEVLDSLRSAGVASMDIHMYGRRLVMVLDLVDGLTVQQVFAAHASSHPRVQEWERLMRSLQEPSSNGSQSESWTVMEPIFRLS